MMHDNFFIGGFSLKIRKLRVSYKLFSQAKEKEEKKNIF